MNSAQVQTITPEKAKKMLTDSHDNYRAINKKHVRHMASEMSAGRWFMTYEPIVVDPVRGVVDGQHRLHAVVLSGEPVDFLVVQGRASIDAIAAMDTGLTRSAATVLHARGVKNASAIAAASRGYAQALMGFMPWTSYGQNRRVSTKVINDIVDTHNHIHEICRICSHRIFKHTGVAGTMAVIAMMAHDDSPSHAFAFLEMYDNAESIADPSDGVRLLYTRMLKAKATSSMKIPPHVKSGLAAKAYNSFVSGYGVGTLRYSLGEALTLVRLSDLEAD